MPGVPELPHELYIYALATKKLSLTAIDDRLRYYGLVSPKSDYLKYIQENNPSTLFTDEQVKEAEALLEHPERELLDVLCVLYRGDCRKVYDDSVGYSLGLTEAQVKTYIFLFWHPLVLNNRVKWQEFMRGLNEESYRDLVSRASYKSLLRLARMGEQEILFWKLGRPKKFKQKRDILEDSVQDLYMRMKETNLMENTESTSRIVSNYGTVLASFVRELTNLESQVVYDDVLKLLQEGVFKIKSSEENFKQLSEIVEHDGQTEGTPKVST